MPQNFADRVAGLAHDFLDFGRPVIAKAPRQLVSLGILQTDDAAAFERPGNVGDADRKQAAALMNNRQRGSVVNRQHAGDGCRGSDPSATTAKAPILVRFEKRSDDFAGKDLLQNLVVASGCNDGRVADGGSHGGGFQFAGHAAFAGAVAVNLGHRSDLFVHDLDRVQFFAVGTIRRPVKETFDV